MTTRGALALGAPHISRSFPWEKSMRPFDAWVAAMAAVDSEFHMSRVPFDVVKNGILDLDARLKALEAPKPEPAPDHEDSYGDAS